MTEVGASREELRACLTGDTAYDVIHVALHGQKDPQGLEDGLVLLEPDALGNPGPTFFNATQVLGLENHASRPFVFLNACQVGSGEAVLGTYAGFALNLLRTRASAVVAPLWNVDDNVAAAITRDFYDSAYGEEPAPVAEILRRVRASYTQAGVQADPESCTPTLVAYQCFGHPHFTLRRHPAG
jgi:CHAT domain-containing protein